MEACVHTEEFRERVTVLTGPEADHIRDRYIARFVDTSSEHYATYIATTTQYRDGLYYVGYLWDTLKCGRVIPEAEILNRPDLESVTIYVMWDLHSDEHIFIEDYWKFPRDAALELTYQDLMAGLCYLPEDIYIFDKAYTWSLILTHESWEAHNAAWRQASTSRSGAADPHPAHAREVPIRGRSPRLQRLVRDLDTVVYPHQIA